MLRFAALSVLAIFVAGAPTTPTDDDVVQNFKQEAMKFNSKFQVPVPYVSFVRKPVNQNKRDARFFLYTSQVPHPVELSINDGGSSIKGSSYNVKYETIVLIGEAMYNPIYLVEMVSAYLRQGYENSTYYNVIVVDYFNYDDMNSAPDFIGKQLGTLLNLCNECGTPYLKMHLIGHGVGAHVAAGAAKYVYPARIDRITGLSPYGDNFDTDQPLVQLRQDSAEFVDTVSSNPRCFGSSLSRGHIRFNATEKPEQQSACHVLHMKVFYYYLESILFPYNFKGVNQETSDVAYMGEVGSRNPMNNVGDYSMSVNEKSPYGASDGSKKREISKKYSRGTERTGKW